jgi:hypothetical protein
MSTSIEGRIAIDVTFADKSDGTNVDSLKMITLTDTASYTSGKVALVSGTCGTAAVVITATNPGPGYTNAAGSQVQFTATTRFAFSATGSPATCSDSNGHVVRSSGGRISVSDAFGADDPYQIQTTSGTASYTLVLYGT